jgi:RNA 2',3'-cyclic 3'-phosphodiesterase
VLAVTKERLKSPRARLFIALDLPAEVRREIEAWCRIGGRDPALRPLRRESLHITLAFLGYRAEKDIEHLTDIVGDCGSFAPSIELRDPVGRPTGSRPRLYALEVISPQTVTLQAALQKSLVAAHLYEPEKRPFWPHVTVARVRPAGRGSKRPADVCRPLPSLPDQIRRPFHGVRVTLYRSKLQPQGAIYTPLAQSELPLGHKR